MSRSHPLTSILIATAAAGLLLAGCSGSADPDGSDAATRDSGETSSATPGDDGASGAPAADESENAAAADPNSQGEATLRALGREFVFTLETCLVGGEDILIGGPGVESGTGVPARLDGGALSDGAGGWIGEFRADVGTAEPFSSMDDFVAVSNFSDRLSHATDGQQFDFAGASWDGTGGERGHGEISFRCS